MSLLRGAVLVALLACALVAVLSPPSFDAVVPSLRARRVLVCGASTGIGRELALLYAESGAHVAVAARRGGVLDELRVEMLARGAASVTTIVADFATGEATAQRTIDEAVAGVGGAQRALDTVFLNHLLPYIGDWTAVPADERVATLRRNMEVTFYSYVYLAEHALPALARSRAADPRLVVVSSAAGLQGTPRVVPYSAAKHALHGYFESLRHDLVMRDEHGRRPADERAVGITLVPLGFIGTDVARETTRGYFEGTLAPADPRDTAKAMIAGVEARLDSVLYPRAQVAFALVFRSLATAAHATDVFDALVRSVYTA